MPEIDASALEHLPTRLLVALTARCATRLTPIIRLTPEDDLTQAALDAIERSVEVAATANPPADFRETWVKSVKAYASKRLDERQRLARGVAMFAVGAAFRFTSYLSAFKRGRFEDSAVREIDARRMATDGVLATSTLCSVTARAVHDDIEHLKAMAVTTGINDSTCIRPEDFGDLWPHGEPRGWPGRDVRRA